MSLPILHGCCTIQIYKKVSGSNFYPHTIVYEVCGNTLVGAAWWLILSQERWLLMKSGKFSYAARHEDIRNIGRKLDWVMMSREILGLPRGAGKGGDEADHKNHDTFDNTPENLRVVTQGQNKMNSRKQWSMCRFKGISENKGKFQSSMFYNNKSLYIGRFDTDVEAALAHFYAGTLVYGEFFHGSEIPVDEMPPEERQEEIWQLVLGKLRAAGFLVGV